MSAGPARTPDDAVPHTVGRLLLVGVASGAVAGALVGGAVGVGDGSRQTWGAGAAALGVGVAALLGIGAYRTTGDLPIKGLEGANAADGGNVQGIAHLLFTKYVFAFEVASALLITAAVGAMLARYRKVSG